MLQSSKWILFFWTGEALLQSAATTISRLASQWLLAYFCWFITKNLSQIVFLGGGRTRPLRGQIKQCSDLMTTISTDLGDSWRLLVTNECSLRFAKWLSGTYVVEYFSTYMRDTTNNTQLSSRPNPAECAAMRHSFSSVVASFMHHRNLRLFTEKHHPLKMRLFIRDCLPSFLFG